MNTEKRQVGTIDLTPSWETAVRIYIACLENPDASANAKQGARDDLLNLGRAMDKVREQKKSIASLGEIKRQAE